MQWKDFMAGKLSRLITNKTYIGKKPPPILLVDKDKLMGDRGGKTPCRYIRGY